MPTYILLSTLTPEGRRTLHSDPDRLDTSVGRPRLARHGQHRHAAGASDCGVARETEGTEADGTQTTAVKSDLSVCRSHTLAGTCSIEEFFEPENIRRIAGQ
jgi:hypothetical protein